MSSKHCDYIHPATLRHIIPGTFPRIYPRLPFQSQSPTGGLPVLYIVTYQKEPLVELDYPG